MWNYQKCEKHWAGRRAGKAVRTIADCGWSREREYMEFNERDGCFDLTLHSTVIVKVFPDKLRLNCGGWWTQLTRRKIGDWTGVHLGGAPYKLRHKIVEDQFLYPHGWSGTPYLFFNGIEIDYGGRVLNPQPYYVKVLKPGASKEFTKVRRAVWERIATRVLIGEFDQRPDDLMTKDNAVPSACELWQCMQQIAEYEIGAVIPREIVDPLLVRRPKKYFGVVRRRWGNHGEEELRSGAQLLESSFTAARRYYHYDNYSYTQVVVPIGE